MAWSLTPYAWGMAVAPDPVCMHGPVVQVLQSKAAQIVGAGQLRRGRYVDDPDFRALIHHELQRIAGKAVAG